MVRGRVVGVLFASWGGGPAATAADVSLVQLFCNQAAIALQQQSR